MHSPERPREGRGGEAAGPGFGGWQGCGEGAGKGEGYLQGCLCASIYDKQESNSMNHQELPER